MSFSQLPCTKTSKLSCSIQLLHLSCILTAAIHDLMWRQSWEAVLEDDKQTALFFFFFSSKMKLNLMAQPCFFSSVLIDHPPLPQPALLSNILLPTPPIWTSSLHPLETELFTSKSTFSFCFFYNSIHILNTAIKGAEFFSRFISLWYISI